MFENETGLLAALWRLKLRLQFTGWLQYLPPALFGLILLMIGLLLWALSLPLGAALFLGCSGLLLTIFSFDLITVKFRLRPPEPLPGRDEALDIFDLMRARRSCRSFQTRMLSPSHRAALLDAVRRHSAAPTIGPAPIRFEYVNAPLTVWPVVNGREFLVAIAPRAYDRLAVIDVGRTLQKIVMDATRLGLGTCWIGPGADHGSIMHHLGGRFNPEEDHIICVCAVGYKSRYIPLLVRIINRQLYGRLPLEKLFFADPDFCRSLPVREAPFNQFGRTYEICQWAPSSYNGQTTRCAAGIEEEEGSRCLTRFDFYTATDSRFYAPVALGIWCANWELGCEVLGIRGDFKSYSAAELVLQAQPRADVSWVLAEPLEVAGSEPAAAIRTAG